MDKKDNIMDNKDKGKTGKNNDKIIINGGNKLFGDVGVSGAKNAAVAIIPAVVLCDVPCTIANIPNISDVALIARILEQMGAEVCRVDDNTLRIHPTKIDTWEVTGEEVRKMRASYYLLGALLGRFRKARVAMPGGCNFGERPIDQHLKGFHALGADCKILLRDDSGSEIELETDSDFRIIDERYDPEDTNNDTTVALTTPGSLFGRSIYMDTVSVGTTINLMLAAVKAEGRTVLEHAAKEPHVVDLANFLNSMGAKIRGAGTDTIKITGVPLLNGAYNFTDNYYSIIPDQIEAGTYMAAAAATRGRITVHNITPKHLESILVKLREMGCEIGYEIEEDDNSVTVDATVRPLTSVSIKTMPHPGFPTDCQPQFVALLTTVKGTSIVNESVWDNRFQYVEELLRMGAKISIVDRTVARIEGCPLKGAPVKATDLRAGAAMLIAGLVAQGQTTISNIGYIERGYSDVVNKFKALGADISRIHDPDPEDSDPAPACCCY